MNLKEYQKNCSELVEMERQAEIDQHLNEIKRLSPQARQKRGRAILYMRSQDAGRGLGGTYLIKYVRPKSGLPDHEISVGDLVIPSSGHPNGNEPQGTVTETTNFSLTVAFNNKPPSFAYKKRVRVDLFANDITFQRMLAAIKSIKDNPTLEELLLGKRPPQWGESPDTINFVNSSLNDSQRQAVQKSLEAEDLLLIHGPPGTGKTTTLTESILQHIKQGEKVLATADSNTAVDNLVENLAGQDCFVLRLGNPARITDPLIKHSLDYKIESVPEYKKATQLWEKVDELKDKQKPYTVPSGKNRRGLRDKQIKRLAEKGKSSRGISPNKIQKMAEWLNIQEQISDHAERAIELTDKASYQLIEEAEVVCTTNSTAGSNLLEEYLNKPETGFDTIFIDEATQAIEPSCLIPMVNGEKFVMAGDHRQLPPTVLNQEAEPQLQYTLFERWLELHSEKIKCLLDVQYRMHEEIMDFPNQTFYNGHLKAHETVAHHTLEDLDIGTSPEEGPEWLHKSLAPTPPRLFINTSTADERGEYQRKGSTSYKNEVEAELAIAIVRKLTKAGLSPGDLGVISPYDDQVERIKRDLKGIEELEVKTVDGFQGREKEVILISFVRSNRSGNIGFLNDQRRLNVSITRAKRKLIMIGNAPTLRHHNIYNIMIDQAEQLTCKKKELSL